MKYYVYAIKETGHEPDDAPVKIGVATSPWRRRYTLQSGNPRELVLMLSMGPFSEKEARALERELHDKFNFYREAGEWFRRLMRNDKLLKHIRARQYPVAYMDVLRQNDLERLEAEEQHGAAG